MSNSIIGTHMIVMSWIVLILLFSCSIGHAFRQRNRWVLASTGRSQTESSSLTTYDTENVKETVLPISIKTQNGLQDGDLVIFVIDMSMPGGIRRIQSVKTATASLLPHQKIAVVGCYRGGAEIKVEPTSSSLNTMRGMANMHSSVMGNLGAGIMLATDLAEKELIGEDCKRAIVAILADGRAHGLRSGSSDCDTAVDCNVELANSAQYLSRTSTDLLKKGWPLSAIVVDTDEFELDGKKEWSTEGTTLAAASKAEYYHVPNLAGNILVSILNDHCRRI